MKYAVIDVETIGFPNRLEQNHINFGDHLQNLIIQDLYGEMGIAPEDIYRLDYNEISRYRGEFLILPINQAITRSFKKQLSPYIIPVFLGISRDAHAIGAEELDYFKRFSPVGCRDQAVFDRLTRAGVDCYFSGCITLTLPRRSSAPSKGKVFLVEVPAFAKKHLPKYLKDVAVELQNIAFGTFEEVTGGKTMEQTVKDRYALFEKEAALVVTSRLHVASPCLAMGIPVIVIKEEIDYRFSWLDKYLPLYTEETVDRVDWSPKVIDLESIKQLKKDVAKRRIAETYEAHLAYATLTEWYDLRAQKVQVQKSYSDAVLSFVREKWQPEERFRYAVWGENDASERLIQFLQQQYPYAQLEHFYDSYKTSTYHGKPAIHPREIRPHDDEFIFVTGYTATDVARKLFETIGKSPDTYYLFTETIRGDI